MTPRAPRGRPFLLIVASQVWLGVCNADHKTTLIYPGSEDLVEQLEVRRQQALLEAQKVADLKYYHPLNRDSYHYDPPTEFTIGLIIDPCKNRDYECCHDMYGTPTYMIPGSELTSVSGTASIQDAFSQPLLNDISRVADRFSVWDPNCHETLNGTAYRSSYHEVPLNNSSTGNEDEDNDEASDEDTSDHDNITTVHVKNFNDATCVGQLQAMVPLDDAIMPPCWDRNTSINALASCQTSDGQFRPNCLSFAYTQTAFVVQCGKAYALDNHCGTFIELHAPNDMTILSQTRLLAEYPSGYRTSTISLAYKGDVEARTLCRGDYELWWVQRTKSKFIIQHTKKFYISTPGCGFDFVVNHYTDFHTIGNVIT